MYQDTKNPMIFVKETAKPGLLDTTVLSIGVALIIVAALLHEAGLKILPIGLFFILLAAMARLLAWMTGGTIWKVSSDGTELHLHRMHHKVTTIPWLEVTDVNLIVFESEGTTRILNIAHGPRQYQLSGTFANDPQFVKTMINYRELSRLEAMDVRKLKNPFSDHSEGQQYPLL